MSLAISLRRSPGDRSSHAVLLGGVLACLVVVTGFLSLAVGPSGFTPAGAARALFDFGARAGDTMIVLDIRLPRTLLGLVVGAALAVSGAVMQGLFRNPLADPGLVGVTAGSALAAVTVVVLGAGTLGAVLGGLVFYLLPLAAFVGGLITTTLLYAIATRQGRTSVATMLLAGIAIGALAGAATGMLIFVSDDRQLRDFTFWTLGSLTGATWEKVGVAAVFLFLVLAVLPGLAAGLDAMLLGEGEARHLGTPVQSIKKLAIFAVAAAVGASVAVAGPIGFIGIVVPHLLRLVIGPRHAGLLPTCALFGAVLLVWADMIARTVVAPAELPIGIVTAILGAPFFLWLLLRQRSIVDL
ncbi:FecCD family ABC transporter permease [Microbaculum sp. FT89]|uniref:FecCD family ABC transporter permease n=1 Tax=Microbaculum sp. FT89 TaxID=3447298 RepID=UPI003F53D8D0